MFAVLSASALLFLPHPRVKAEIVCPNPLVEKAPVYYRPRCAQYMDNKCYSNECYDEMMRCWKEIDQENKEIGEYNKRVNECKAAFKNQDPSRGAQTPSRPAASSSATNQSGAAHPNMSKLLQDTKKRTQGTEADRTRQKDELQTAQAEVKKRNEERAAAEAKRNEERAAEEAKRLAAEQHAATLEEDRKERERVKGLLADCDRKNENSRLICLNAQYPPARKFCYARAKTNLAECVAIATGDENGRKAAAAQRRQNFENYRAEDAREMDARARAMEARRQEQLAAEAIQGAINGAMGVINSQSAPSYNRPPRQLTPMPPPVVGVKPPPGQSGGCGGYSGPGPAIVCEK